MHTISKAKQRWLKATEIILSERQRAPTGQLIAEIGDAHRIAQCEHMADIDRFDGAKARRGDACKATNSKGTMDLFVVSPVIDGRLKDLGRVST